MKKTSLDPAAVRALTNAASFEPGKRVEFVRPAISANFLAVSACVLGGCGAFSIYLFQQNFGNALPWVSRTLGQAGFGLLAATAVVAFLQAAWPARRIVIDWPADAVVSYLGRRKYSHSLRSVNSVMLRETGSHRQLDLRIGKEHVRLFDSDDRGAMAASLPLAQLDGLAVALSDALSVRVERAGTAPETSAFRWRHAGIAIQLAGAWIVLMLGLHAFRVLPGAEITLPLVVIGGISGLGVALLTAPRGAALPDVETGWQPVNAGGAFYILGCVLLVGAAGWALETLPISTVGVVIGGILCLALIPFWMLVPDLVHSQRCGAMSGGWQLLRLRLRMFPVWLLTDAAGELRRQGFDCSLLAIASVYSESPSVRNANDLAQAVLQKFGKKFPVRRITTAESVMADKYHQPKFILTSLIGALLALSLIGFFFVVCNGVEYTGILFWERNWVETPATIESTERVGSGRNSATQYRFSFDVSGVRHEATCFGPSRWDSSKEARAKYDRDHPEVALLLGGMRSKSTPFLPLLFAGLSLLVILPLPIVVGHAAAGGWQCMRQLFSR